MEGFENLFYLLTEKNKIIINLKENIKSRKWKYWCWGGWIWYFLKVCFFIRLSLSPIIFHNLSKWINSVFIHQIWYTMPIVARLTLASFDNWSWGDAVRTWMFCINFFCVLNSSRYLHPHTSGPLRMFSPYLLRYFKFASDVNIIIWLYISLSMTKFSTRYILTTRETFFAIYFFSVRKAGKLRNF